ncbi:hypothetical protein N7517_004743 [Penicillium concentricum]|uniref:Uncharacterized protein n=1 Tax=Penicillium concentricum TaxID=293559 RepID=A0A9W9S6X0_9EURO|nr:uncharacterized protein N7517_004743 [Penicillium concentricum]KAJ5372737.1 hypothetical protein N7517_004743 [Penicillium concentricum]
MQLRVLELGALANLAVLVSGLNMGRHGLQVRDEVASSSATPASPEISSLAISSSSAEWKDMQCSQISGDPADQWKQAGVEAAWDTTIASWKEQGTPDAGGFPLFVSSFIHGPQGMRCGDIGTENRCSQPVECADATIPAGALILNGFTGIHQLHASIFQAIGLAQDGVTNNVGTFTSAFAPQPKDNGAMIKMIIDATMLVVTFGTSVLYNVVLQNVANLIGKAIAAEMTGAVLSTAVTYYKTNMKGAIEGLKVQNTMDSFVGVVMKSWQRLESSYLESIFSGNSDTIEGLYATINNGTIAAAMDKLNLVDTSDEVEKLLYGQMIAYAWSISPDNAHPFIWRSEIYCDENTTPIDKGAFVEQTSLSKIYVCHQNKMHLLVNAHQKKGTGFSSTVLPGGEHDTLNGKDYGGITIDDIVISSVDGWINHNQQNGYPKADAESIVASFGGDNVPSVRTPGFFNLPICLNVAKAEDNIRYGWDKSSPYWPCENPEGYTSSGTNIHIDKGCILVNDSKVCHTGTGAYNVPDPNQDDSSATIYAMFEGKGAKLMDKEKPQCKLTVSWPRAWGDLDFTEENCLQNRSPPDSSEFWKKCCSDFPENTDLVDNPYGPS